MHDILFIIVSVQIILCKYNKYCIQASCLKPNMVHCKEMNGFMYIDAMEINQGAAIGPSSNSTQYNQTEARR